MIFIDSNYWIYLFDQTTEEHQYVKAHFGTLFDEFRLAVSTVVMIEVMHYLIKRLGPSDARKKWDLFSSIDFMIGDLTYEDLDGVYDSFSRYSHSGIGGRDATILSFMEANNITKLCTHDQAFKKIPDLEIIDPIPEN